MIYKNAAEATDISGEYDKLTFEIYTGNYTKFKRIKYRLSRRHLKISTVRDLNTTGHKKSEQCIQNIIHRHKYSKCLSPGLYPAASNPF